MSYNTLNQLKNSFIASVGNTPGLNGFYMIDESEINKIHNVSYPACFLDIPDSSISNVNKAWEDYELSCLILKPEPKIANDNYSINFYDEALALFEGLLHNLAGQRNGDYALDSSSISIERVSNLGNDLSIGCRVKFTLSVPSILIGASTTTVLAIPTTGLHSHFNIDNSLSISSSSLNWNAKSPNASKRIAAIDHVGDKAKKPYYNHLGKSLIFTGETLGGTNGVQIGGTSFSSPSFSIFFKCHIPAFPGANQGNTTGGYLISTEPNGLGFTFEVKLVTSGAHEGKFTVRAKDSRGDVTSSTSDIIKLTPITSSDGYATLGIINDHSAQKIYISVGTTRYTLAMYSDFSINNNDIHIGCRHRTSTLDNDGLEMQLKDVVIYSRALPTSEVANLNAFLTAN